MRCVLTVELQLLGSALNLADLGEEGQSAA